MVIRKLYLHLYFQFLSSYLKYPTSHFAHQTSHIQLYTSSLLPFLFINCGLLFQRRCL